MAQVLEPGSALRRQLEGRWERIEQAQERYSALTRALDSWGWRAQLRLQPRLPAEIREHEPALEEVLQYMERRAQLEHWPTSHPGPASLRAIRSQRIRLEALARRRLAQVVPERGGSFEEVMGQLEALAMAPVPQPPAMSEPVLLEGDTWFAPGQFWLTPERLVWYPWNGEPEQLTLKTVDPGSITLLPGGLGVRVEGERRLTLTSPFLARSLANLLRRSRLLPRGATAVEGGVITRGAYRDTAGSDRSSDAQWGVSVFRPGYLAFLPERRLTLLDRVKRFVGLSSRREPSERHRLEQLLKHLQRLPAAEFDRCVEEIARARGGALWMAANVRRVSSLMGRGLRFRVRQQTVVVPRDSGLDVALDEFIGQHWPYGDARFALTARPGWWARHARSLVLLGIGTFLQLNPLTHGPGLPPFVPLSTTALGMGITVLGWMRYVKAKGLPPLLGLLGLVSCPGWFILLFLPDKNEPPSGSR